MNDLTSGASAAGAVPHSMRERRQFVLWKLIAKPDNAKPAKMPFDPKTGLLASTTDPATWSDYDTACRVHSTGGYDGIGFVFTIADPFALIDLDHCREETGNWTQFSEKVVAMFPEAAWETSQSGNGLHGIVIASDKAALADKARKWADDSGNQVEFYTHGRFCAFGKHNWTRLDLMYDYTGSLASWVPDRNTRQPGLLEWEDAARPNYAGPADDDELIRKMLASRGALSVLGKAPNATGLWNADPVELGRFFPDSGGKSRAFDHSSADLSLANLLAFWTGCNPARMERLFARSKLARGDRRKTRLAIAKAIGDPGRKYVTTADRREQRIAGDMLIGDDLPTAPLPTVLTLPEAMRDLVFVGFGSQIVHRQSKRIRNREDAQAEYAASKHAVDTGKFDREGKAVVRDVPVLKLWLESQNRKSVDVVTWQPGSAEICGAPETTGAGRTAYNLWMPPQALPPPTNWQLWADPFIQHVAYLVPIETERKRFLQWLAHTLQRPGELPHTCYLMVATSTGIGRGTLASILARVFRGYMAANADVGMLLDRDFNGRLAGKLFATVDEIREGSSQRYQQKENFKSAVVEEIRYINPKFGRQYAEKNCCRWLLFSNYLDALPFDNNDRRIIVIENPPTPANPDWFEYLHHIMDDPNFIASVQHYLATLDISSFKAGERAPMTDAKKRALASMETTAERNTRQFQTQWPGSLATLRDLREFCGDDDAPRTSAWRHILDRAGMMTSPRKVKINGRPETILIVRDLTLELVDAMTPMAISGHVATAREAWRIGGF